jgi:N-glycosylase/DNA lyase
MELQETYLSIKSQIDERLKEFQEVGKDPIARIREFVFCLCTPQTDAHKGWAAANQIVGQRVHKYPQDYIESILRESGVRFHKTKTERIFKNLQQTEVLANLLDHILSGNDPKVMRHILVSSIYGYGMKEASHFLRNVGKGQRICILDRHILRKLAEYKVIKEVPKMTKKKYPEIEEKMIQFADKIEIPVDSLDFVFWYQAKGEIFR